MRFYFFAVIIAGIMLLVNLAGFTSPSGGLINSFNLINSSSGEITFENFKNSELWSNDESTDSIPGLTFILLGAVVAGLVLGTFGRAPDIRYITAAMVFALTGLLVADLVWLFIKMRSYGIDWLTNVSLLILAPLTVGLFITALNFWQGND